jgi:protein-disulfide isomerase
MSRAFSRKSLLQLLVVILIGWGVSHLLQRTAPIGRDVSTNHAAQAILAETLSPVKNVQSPTLTLVIFTDYRCPACKRANPAMESAIAADGHVRMVYKDLPIFGPLSEQAARVAIASAAQGIYPALHSRLMGEGRRLDEPVLREAVERSGGNWDRLRSDLKENAVAIDRQLALNRANAFSLGIPGTPAYLAGPILLVGGTDETGFRRLFARARKTAAGT